VLGRFNEYVEAWEQREEAERQLKEFEANSSEPPYPRELMFDGIDSLIEYNRKRREYLTRREELRRNRDESAKRLKERASVVQVL
jgi:hypothetical protein